MQLVDRIELRRFVGREWLLWLWFESEVLDATLHTKAHGSFGLWIEGRLVLSAGKEVTTIKGAQPGQHREAKEALLRGKLPDLASLHLTRDGQDAAFTIRAEKMAIAGLKLPKAEEDASEGDAPGAPAALTRVDGPAVRRKPARTRADAADEAAAFESDQLREAFYERMRATEEVEGIIQALYTDFLTLRLGATWEQTVVPALNAWISGEDVDVDAYGRAKTAALRRSRASQDDAAGSQSR
jgi:hypothetical protein